MIEKLKNFPFILTFLVYAGYLGIQFYDFQYASEGQTGMHLELINKSKAEIAGLKKKLTEGTKFLKNLEAKKEDLRLQSKKLTEYQGALSESLDVPALIKVLITETKRINLKVDRIEPGRRIPNDYFVEQEFKLDVKGSYAQIVLLAQRISQLQRILRIEAFSLKPSTGSSMRVRNQLDGQFSVRAYKYTASKEDEIAETFK